MNFPQKYENAEIFKKNLFNIAKAKLNEGHSIEAVKKIILDELFLDINDLHEDVQSEVKKELNEYTENFENFFGEILTEFEKNEINDLENKLSEEKFKLETYSSRLDAAAEKTKNKKRSLSNINTSVNELETRKFEISEEDQADSINYTRPAIKSLFILNKTEELESLDLEKEVLKEELDTLNASINNNVAANAQNALHENIASKESEIKKIESTTKQILKLLNNSLDDLSFVGEDSREFEQYLEKKLKDKEERSLARETQLTETKNQLKSNKEIQKKSTKEYEKLREKEHKLRNNSRDQQQECLTQQSDLKDLINETLQEESIKESFSALIDGYKKLKNKFKKLNLLDQFEDIFSVEALDTAIDGINNETNKKSSTINANKIMSIISGAASAFGLSQTLPKIFFDNNLFLDEAGQSVDQTAVWSIAAASGLIVGTAAGKFRERILNGTEDAAKKLRNNPIKALTKGISKELLGLNIDTKKFSPKVLLTGLILMGATLGAVKPAKEAWKNFPSVPSNALGAFTWAFGDKVQEGSKTKVIDLSNEVFTSTEALQESFENAEDKTIKALEQYIQDEIDGTGVSKDPGFGTYAKAKSFAIDGKMSRTGRGNFTVKQNLLSLLKNQGISKNNGLIQKLETVNDQQDLLIANQLNKISPELASAELTKILSGGNLLTASIKLQEYALSFEKNIDSLIISIKQKNEKNKEYASVVADALGGIDKISAANSGNDFSVDFLPKVEAIDVSKIEALKEKIVQQLANLSPFISDLDAAAKIVSPEHAKMLSNAFVLLGLLIELGALLYGIPSIYRNTRKKYGEVYGDLYSEYGDFINRQKSNGNIAVNQEIPKEEKLFKDGLNSFTESMEKSLAQVVLGSLYQINAFPSSHNLSPENEQLLLSKIVQAIRNTYTDTETKETKDLSTKLLGLAKSAIPFYGSKNQHLDSELQEKNLLHYTKNLVNGSNEIKSLIKKLSLGGIDIKESNMDWIDVQEEVAEKVLINISTYSQENRNYPSELKKKNIENKKSNTIFYTLLFSAFLATGAIVKTTNAEKKAEEKKSPQTEVTKLTENIKDIYGMNVLMDSLPDDHHVFHKTSTTTDKEKFLSSLTNVLKKYPSTVYDKFPKNLFIAKDIQKLHKGDTIPLGGYANNEIIALDLESSAEHSTDHELLHFFEHDTPLDNKTWGLTAHGKNYEKLYGKSGADAIANGTINNDRPTGFAEAYGKFGGIQEDQATVAEILMMGDKNFDNSIQNEPELKAKIEMMKQYYYDISDGLMDEQYWQDLRNGVTIDQNYWDSKSS